MLFLKLKILKLVKIIKHKKIAAEIFINQTIEKIKNKYHQIVAHINYKINMMFIKFDWYFWKTGNTFFSRKFHKFLFLIGLKKFLPNFVWLNYISCLIDIKKDKQALKLLHQYIEIFGTEFIQNYCIISNFACNNGIESEKIKKSQQIFQKLQENEKNNVFAKLFENKTVAFVGNGPQEAGKNKGSEIDSHDIVIRFNNYEIKGFEKDYGTKTDIWIRGFGGDDLKDYTHDNKYLFAGITGNYYRIHILWDFQFDILYRDLVERNIATGYISPKLYSECRDKMYKKTDPTSGCSAIYTVLKIAKNCTFDFYGFGFLENKTVENCSSHYFNDREKEEAIARTQTHNLNKENDFLRKFLELS